MKLATKIYAGFLFLVAVLIALEVLQLSLIQHLHAENRKLSRIGFEAMNLSLQMRRTVELLSRFTDKLGVLRTPEYATELTRIRREVARDLARLQALELADSERRASDRLMTLWQAYVETAPQQEKKLMSPTGMGSARGPRPAEHFDNLRAQLTEVMRASQATMSKRVAESEAKAERSRWVAWGAGALGTAAALLISVWIVQSVATPLRQLTHGIRELAKGDFGYRVTPSGSPEFAALAMNFNTMADRLRELDQLKKDFVSNVSHDLKAPMACMQETTRLLLEGIPGPLREKQEHLLRLNLRCADRLSTMIENLLRLARVEARALEYDFNPHDIRELAGAVLDELDNSIREKRFSIQREFPDGPLWVKCDRPFMLQVLGNLLSNAVKFSNTGSAIGIHIKTLTTTADHSPAPSRNPSQSKASQALIEIWDSGPGVPEDQKEKIFERFYRVDAEKKGGTGLGLAIARTIVDGHGGALWVRDHPGGGSIFCLRLPLAPSPSSPEVSEETHRGMRKSGAAPPLSFGTSIRTYPS